MTIYVPIWKYMKDKLPACDNAVISQLRVLFTDSHAAFCAKKPRKWVIAHQDLHHVDRFLADESNIKVAEAHVTGLMMGSGSAKARGARHSMRATVNGVRMVFESEFELQDFIDKEMAINAGLHEEVVKLRALVANRETVSSMRTHTPASTPSSLADRRNSKGNRKALEKIAVAIADRPEIYLGAKSRREIVLRIVDLAAALGLTTMHGKAWKEGNIFHYQNWLADRVKELTRERNAKKGKIRVRMSANNGMTIAA